MNLNTELHNIMNQVFTNEKLTNFQNEGVGPNTVRISYVLMCTKRYNYQDARMGNTVAGITFTFTDDIALHYRAIKTKKVLPLFCSSSTTSTYTTSLLQCPRHLTGFSAMNV